MQKCILILLAFYALINPPLFALTDDELIQIAKECVEQNYTYYELKSPYNTRTAHTDEVQRAIEDLETSIKKINTQISLCTEKQKLLGFIVDQKNIMLLTHRINGMDEDEICTYSNKLQTDLIPGETNIDIIKQAIHARIMGLHPTKRAEFVIEYNTIDEAGLDFVLAKMNGAQRDLYAQEKKYRQDHKLSLKAMALIPIARKILATHIDAPPQNNDDDDDNNDTTEEQVVFVNDQNTTVNPEFNDDAIPLFQPATTPTNGLSQLINNYAEGDEDNDSDMDVE